MIKIDDVIVSDEVLEKKFICDINSCKGQCCVKGDAGAPLEKEDIKKLKKNYKHIKPYMTKKGIGEVEKKGIYVRGSDGDFETPIINGKECAYAFFDEKGIALCSIQKSFEEKKDIMKEVRNYEPSKALFADEKGLYFYRKIIENLSKHLKRKQFLFLEVGINQPDGVVKILKNNNFNVVSIKKDISNIPRCIIAERS